MEKSNITWMEPFYGQIEKEFGREFLKDLTEGKLSRGLILDLLEYYGIHDQVYETEYEALKNYKHIPGTKENVEKIYEKTNCLSKWEIRKHLKPLAGHEERGLDPLVEMSLKQIKRLY